MTRERERRPRKRSCSFTLTNGELDRLQDIVESVNAPRVLEDEPWLSTSVVLGRLIREAHKALQQPQEPEAA